METVSFEEFNGEYIPQDLIDSFYEKMKHAVVKIFVLEKEANDENKVLGMENQDADIRLARKQAAAEEFNNSYLVGTGAIIKKRYILTASHVLDGAKVVFIRKIEKNDYYCCSIVNHDDAIDLALLRIERKSVEFLTKRVKFPPGNDPMIGSQALHIGHPNNYDYSFLKGAVAHPRRSCEGPIATEFHIRNLHGVEGSSGGPIFNASGFLIGILLSVQRQLGLIAGAHMDVIKPFLEKSLPPGQLPKNIVVGHYDEEEEEEIDEKEEPEYLVKASGFDVKDVEDDDNIDEGEEEKYGDVFFYHLAKLFGECGNILRISFHLSKNTKKRKRYALFEFEDEEGVQKALQGNGKKLFSKTIKVEAVRGKHGL